MATAGVIPEGYTDETATLVCSLCRCTLIDSGDYGTAPRPVPVADLLMIVLGHMAIHLEDK